MKEQKQRMKQTGSDQREKKGIKKGHQPMTEESIMNLKRNQNYMT